jgi:hypothetical protein
MSFFASFDPDKVVESINTPMAPLPVGDYPCRIEEASERPNKAGNGILLVLTLKVNGTHKITHYINAQHSNAQAEQIGQAELKAICESLGLVGSKRPRSAAAFVGGKLTAHVVQEPYTNKNGEERVANRIKRFVKQPKQAAPAVDQDDEPAPWEA